nr:GAF domain-containing sensor histidine kinase [Anaerolineae bacterium]
MTANLDGQTLAKQLRVLNQLVEISLVMNAMHQLDPLLHYLMEIAAEITDSEAASILLIDKNTNDLVFTAATGESGRQLIGMVVPLEGSIAGSIIKEDRALIIDNVKADPRHYTGVDEETKFETRSILGVPMRKREQLVGVLEVLNKQDGRYDDDDIRFISALASQAAVAIEKAQLVNSLEEAYADLDRLNKLKSDFIAVASHELRTPLGVILGYATVLREDSHGELSDHAQMVLDSALQMRSLIEGMTNLRYVQIDESELDFAPVPLHEIMQSAYADIKRLAEAKDQIFEIEIPEEPVELRADRARLAMALTNVLNNAVKFAPPGGVIMISAERHDSEYWVIVRDNGLGIAKDQCEKIFEQFYQVEDPMTRHHGGLGLGLAIARAIVERHGGRIWAESPGLGEGSRFTLALPVTREG